MPRHDITRLQLGERHLRLLRALLAEYAPGAQVWAYGSRVTGQAHEGSDLDIVVRNPANLAAETPNWADLQDALRDSDLPRPAEVSVMRGLSIDNESSWAWNPASYEKGDRVRVRFCRMDSASYEFWVKRQPNSRRRSRMATLLF